MTDTLIFAAYRKKPVVIHAAVLENGDYLVKGTEGEYYAVPAAIFPTIYDPEPDAVNRAMDDAPAFTSDADAVTLRATAEAPDAPWVVTDLTEARTVLFTGTKPECVDWASEHCRSAHSIHPANAG